MKNECHILKRYFLMYTIFFIFCTLKCECLCIEVCVFGCDSKLFVIVIPFLHGQEKMPSLFFPEEREGPLLVESDYGYAWCTKCTSSCVKPTSGLYKCSESFYLFRYFCKKSAQ